MNIVDFLDFNSIISAFSENPFQPKLYLTITDMEGQILAVNTRNEKYYKFHKQEADYKKIISVTEAAARFKNGEKYILHTCPNGLINAIVPISVENENIGYLIAGHLFLHVPDLDYFSQMAGKKGSDADEYLSAISNFPVFDEDKLLQLLGFFSKIISHFGSVALQTYHQITMMNQLKELTEKSQALEALMIENEKIKKNMAEAQHIAQMGSWEWDIKNNKLYLSDEIYSICGIEDRPDPSNFAFALRYVHPKYRKDIIAKIREIISKKIHSEIEYQLVRKDGSIRDVKSKGQAYYNWDGTPLRLVGTLRDITERKKAEGELRRTSELLKKVIDNVPATIIWLDRDQRVRGINSNPLRVLGKDLSVFIGKKYSELFSQGSVALYNSENIEVMQSNKPIIGAERKVAYAGLPERWIRVNKIPLTDKDDVVEGMLLMIEDITQRKQQENVLKEMNENNKMILDSTYDGIAMYDRTGIVLNVNKEIEKRTSKTKAELVGKNIKELFPVEQHGDLYETRFSCIRKVFETGKPVACEDFRGNMYLENRYYPVYKEGAISYVTMFSADITGRKKAEEETKSKLEYQAKVKVLTDFFINISHELRTPLSVILAQLELMGLYLEDQQTMEKLIAVATQNSHRLTRLVGNILDISKLDAGFIEVRLVYMDIVSLVREICESVEVYASEKYIQLQFKTKITVIKLIPTDAEKVERILLNLLSNAIKHTAAGGKIKVCLKDRKDGGVTIEVEDNGEGIPQNKLNIIFDRFAQVDTALNRENQGSGIGLALTKSLVELLHGSISVKSELGRGSKFTVGLPLIEIHDKNKPIETRGYSLNKKAEMELSDL